jgi:hypothetical protein
MERGLSPGPLYAQQGRLRGVPGEGGQPLRDMDRYHRLYIFLVKPRYSEVLLTYLWFLPLFVGEGFLL